MKSNQRNNVKSPPRNPKKRTKAWAHVTFQTWVINEAKWKAAEQYCGDRKYEFKIMTEDDLGISHDRRRY